MTRRRILALIAVTLVGAALSGMAYRLSRQAPRNPSPAVASPSAGTVEFVEIARKAGIDFRHNNGARGKKYMPETVGAGVAFFDYDNDGWQDVLFVNSDNWPGDRDRHDTLHLYRNNRDGTFTDKTREAGLSVEMYGMGAAVGDYDNDGDRDLFLTTIGPNRLFRNRLAETGRAHFEDVTKAAGVAGYPVPAPFGLRWKWSASAAWLDYDKDGRLDLFVTNYVKWSPKTDVWCGKPGGPKAYCPPESFEGVPCELYRNEGNGRFRDVSEETGVRTAKTVGKSFGLAVADYNRDGWPDIAVANDMWPNFLFVNQDGKRFVERGLESGIAYDDNGKTKAGMGIDAADWNNDGRFGLLIGNFSAQQLSLFRNETTERSGLLFTNIAERNTVGAASLNYLTFGLFFFDYNLDGWQDMLTANGHIDEFVNESEQMVFYKERPLLFRNRGKGQFQEVGKSSGAAMKQEEVGRGLAYGDIDNDGDLDVALVSNGRRGLLYRNDGGNRNRWIRFRAVGGRSNRDGIGALIKVTVGGVTQSQYVKSGGSFLSESQREPTFGLGEAQSADAVEVLWPSGVIDRSGRLRAGQQYVIHEGRGFTPDNRGPITGGVTAR